MNRWVLLGVTVLLTAGANLVLKYASMRQVKSEVVTTDARLLDRLLAMCDPLTIGGLALLGVAFVAYVMSLRNLDLSVAYPVMTSGAMVLVAIGSISLLNEPLSITRIIGTLLIIAGVVVVTR